MVLSTIPHYRLDEPEGVADVFRDEPLLTVPMPEDPKGLAVQITSPYKDALVFDCLKGRETLSDPFVFHVRAYSDNHQLDFGKAVGKNVAVCFETAHKEKRFFAGVVTQLQMLQTALIDLKEKKYLAYYGFTLRPKFWLLTLSRQTRVFVGRKTQEIIESVLKEGGVTFENKATALGKEVREYCVQYNESDFDFVCRLMEEEGIFYCFEYSAAGDKLVLLGQNKSADKLPKPLSFLQGRSTTLNRLDLFNVQAQVTAKAFSAIDYDYMKPDPLLKAKAADKGAGGEVYEYPGGYETASAGEKVAKRRIDEIRWPHSLAFGHSSVLKFQAGVAFELEDHPRKDLNTDYLLYSVTHHLKQRPEPEHFVEPDLRTIYTNNFKALPLIVPFMPMRKTPRPAIAGNQTAVVVGPKDAEVHTDKEGRVLVQFHWDTEAKKDGKNSIPVRYMQGWAGEAFGMAAVPRIGMEVVISFMEGNPDRPLIIGCVYNGKNKMPPEVLKEPRITMLKTKTSPVDGQKGNRLMFDDTKEKEKVTFNLTKDLEVSSIAEKNLFLMRQEGKETTTRTEIVDGMMHTNITKGEKKTEIAEGNYIITLTKGSLEITLEDGDAVTTLTKGNYIIDVKDGTLSVHAKKDISITSDAAISVKAEKDIKLTSNAGITLKASKDIKLDAGGSVNIKAGKDLKETATANVSRQGNKITDKANMDVAINGLNIKMKASLACAAEGLNMEHKATLSYKGSALTIMMEGQVTGMWTASATAILQSKALAGVQGAAVSALGGGGAIALG